MSTMAWDWLMFASGMVALCFAVWLRRARGVPPDARAPLKPSRLGAFFILGGCLLGVQDLLELRGGARWQPVVVGAAVGAGLGAAAGRWGVREGRTARAASRPSSLSKWLRSWSLAASLLLALFLLATLRSLEPALAIVFAHTDAVAAVSSVATGFLLAFGISLAASDGGRSHDRRPL